jgi:hypothetical protein
MATTLSTPKAHRSSIVARIVGATFRSRSHWRSVAAGLVLLGGLASTAQATDLRLDPNRFFLVYAVKGITSPNYHVVPAATGMSPFNTVNTPFLIPCDVENFGGQITAALGPSGPAVYWKIKIQLFSSQSPNIPIQSTGFSGTTPPFDYLAGGVTPPVQPGAQADAGYTVLSTVHIFRDFLFQPRDLGMDPVLMVLTITPYQDAQFKHPLEDTDRSNNVLDIWVQRACGSQ